MKIRGALFIATLGLLVSLRAAEPKFEFSGVMTNEGKTRIALTDKTSGATTWVEPGEKYLGYSIDRYDAKEDAIFLKKDGSETRLSLIAAKTPAAANTNVAAASATASATEAAANAIRANLRSLAGAARRYQLERGATNVTYADLVGPDKIIRELKPVAGESYANLAFGPTASALTVSMTDGTLVSVDIPAAPVTPNTSAVASQPTTPATPAPATGAAASQPATLATPTTVAAVPPAPPPPSPTPAAAVPSTPAPAAIPSEPAPVNSAYAQSESLEATGRPAATPSSYTTAANETWESVAQKNGVTVDQLKQLNPSVISASSLPEGRPLRIR
jgi:LysM repeat protein